MSLEAQIEGILFYVAEPLSVDELARILESTPEHIREAVMALRQSLTLRGIVLVEEGDVLALMTAPTLASRIETMRKEALRRDIGKAGAETLAIIAYLGSATRAEIDFIRGVNSTFILRNLMIRGLIERVENAKDKRSFAYTPTLELFAHLGITRKEDLPNYGEMTEAIGAYRKEEAVRTTTDTEVTS